MRDVALGFAASAAILLQPSVALDNGFTVPAMGYSTWNDCGSFRNNGPDGWCWNAEDHVKNTTRYMITSGLAKMGYNRVNIDEGWLVGRDADGKIYEDLKKFPSGMKGLGDWVREQETYPGSGDYMHYGLYTSRGTVQCGQAHYSAKGSHGYEKADVDWMVAAGADYLKIDSCGGSQDHATAFSDYAKFRDAMNATGKRVWFSLCGWEEWYSPPDPALNYSGGASLGNSWRIHGDGSGWGPLTGCMNTQAAAAPYAVLGGWPDPDLLIGPKVYVGGQTDVQARAQFSMWALFPTNLLISQNMLQWSAYAFETYSNAEAIAINQDSLGSPARRIVGGDLNFPCTGDKCTNVWGRKLSNGDFAIGMVNNRVVNGTTDVSATEITCDAECFSAMGLTTGTYQVRDLWAHKDVATVSPPYGFTAAVDDGGSAALFRLSRKSEIMI